jgi:hypothetical protein
MERLFIDRYGEIRVDIWCAVVVSLMLSYLSSAVVLLNLLGLQGWDLAGGFVLFLIAPGILGFGLFYLFQPLKDRHLYGKKRS